MLDVLPNKKDRLSRKTIQKQGKMKRHPLIDATKGIQEKKEKYYIFHLFRKRRMGIICLNN